MLQEFCQGLLKGLLHKGSNTVECNPSSSVAAPVAAGPSRGDGSSRIDEELKSLFPHHFHQPSCFGSHGNAATNNQRRSKKRKTKGSEDKSKKCKTATLKFVCLSDKDQSETPDAEEQRDLLLADLGEVKITVPEESDELEICNLIMETFSKLLDAGGFELMYPEPWK